MLGSIFITKRGGLRYLVRKIYRLRDSAMYDTPFYQDKKSHFETLPKKLESEIIFLGDSLTDLCEWAELLQNNRIKNRGICGDTTDGILNRLSHVVESKPLKLFILIGINDLNQGRQIAEILNNYSVTIKNLKEKTPETQIFIQSILPVNSQKFPNYKINEKIVQLNSKLRDLAQEYSYQYIDLFSSFLDSSNELDARYTTDGIHLNGQGYLIWKGIIEEVVTKN